MKQGMITDMTDTARTLDWYNAIHCRGLPGLLPKADRILNAVFMLMAHALWMAV